MGVNSCNDKDSYKFSNPIFFFIWPDIQNSKNLSWSIFLEYLSQTQGYMLHSLHVLPFSDKQLDGTSAHCVGEQEQNEQKVETRFASLCQATCNWKVEAACCSYPLELPCGVSWRGSLGVHSSEICGLCECLWDSFLPDSFKVQA